MDGTAGEVEFRGTDRFRLVRRLGAGGMGVVYEAQDEKLSRRVALKTIRTPDVELLYRLKREFRALADLAHTNLIGLFDLVVDDGVCFFTMELLGGRDFVSACRTPGVEGAAGLREDRLRAALPQLVAGLCALHAAGKVHRDVKPSNVMVEDDGRVVLLDFGVATDTTPSHLDTISSAVSGTAEYMAPEQARGGDSATYAADWYAVGVMLFEAMTGTLPFRGSLFEILIQKNREDAPSAGDVAPGVPADLAALCADLLAREPEDRPTGETVAARVGSATRTAPAAAPAPAAVGDAPGGTPFAGREAELGALTSAFERAAAGEACLALVVGASGIGKSALVREFLGAVRARRPDAVVLEGRCYERELVPFRAIDGLIDHLAHVWRSLPPAEGSALLPRDASALPRLFPVLARVPSIAAAPAPREGLDPKELRARAFRALREALQRFADRRPLVLVVDDLQWVDTGTLTLLADLLRPPDPPPFLLVLSTRAEGAPALERLAAGSGVKSLRVDVGPLPEQDAAGLAARLLGDASPETARRVAKEAEGSPFFLGELARHVRARGGADVGTVRLEDVLAARLDALEPSSRALLEVVALSGEPIDPAAAGVAAAVPAGELPREAAALRAGRLLRAAQGEGDALLEPYHDRIRRSVLDAMSEGARRMRHGALATALEGQGSAERLARHWAGAGEPARAAAHALKAAAEAEQTHHFDHAADLYKTALALSQPAGEERRSLLVRLSGALRDAGRGAEAARAGLEAAEGAEPAAALERRRRAAEDLLVGGHVPEGLEVSRAVLEAIGERIPPTPRAAVFQIVRARLRLALRGLSFTERSPDEIPPARLARLDTLLSVALGLTMVDNVRGAGLQARALLEALAVGEPRRVGRSLAFEGNFRSSQTNASRRRARVLIAEARRLAERFADPNLVMWVGLSESFALYCDGDYANAEARVTETEAWIRSETTGNTWGLNNARIFLLQTLRHRGAWARLAPLFHDWTADARRRGDRYAETTFVRSINGVWLAADEPAAARAALEAAPWPIPTGGYHIQSWYAWRARVEIALYEGGDLAALLHESASLERSMLTRVQTIRTESRWLLGRLLLSGAAGSVGVERRVLSLAARLEKERVPYAVAWATMLRAGAAPSPAAWRAAYAAADAAQMGMVATAAGLQGGRLAGGEPARASRAAAEAYARANGVANLDRMVAVLAPAVRSQSNP